MKSSHSSTNEHLNWNSSLLELSPRGRPSKSIEKLFSSEFKHIKDLLWILPLRISPIPTIAPFSELKVNNLFLGTAEVINIDFTPVYSRGGKGGVQLFNATIVVKDKLSNEFLNLKFFNTYPSLKIKLEAMDVVTFMGIVSDYRGTLQIINPKLNPKPTNDKMIIEYPTIAKVSGTHINRIINKIPNSLWEKPLNFKFLDFHTYFKRKSINHSFQFLHGKIASTPSELKVHKESIIYEEFLGNQLMAMCRKSFNKSKKSSPLEISSKDLKKTISLFPFELTPEQSSVLDDILKDLNSGTPMMRMLQGDVGCGKTCIAQAASYMMKKSGGQIAIMCPTEALATQHLQSFKEILGSSLKIEILLGSTSKQMRKGIYEGLKSGGIDLIIGTHSLFQGSVQFKHLQLIVIDEQHKFGVDQRQRLISKGHNAHTLIMTATPIPRTLQLAQYGDLDISTIRSLPSGRKPIQTRIIERENYWKYLNFLKTRLSLGEQVYIVVPAIEESEKVDLNNIIELTQTYREYFPEYKVEPLHGQLKTEEKLLIMQNYEKGLVNILVSTSVIEVGINILNATTISIYNPERFGLSSLHQLRGRVGRSHKSGFCFLVNTTNISYEAKSRLKVIENSNDGFEISEADLKNRGEGNIFGKEQSGHNNFFKLANIVLDLKIFEAVTQDIKAFTKECPKELESILQELSKESNISSTI